MWDLVAHLVPEMMGLAITPAAVIACLLLLASSHPARNVAALAGVFLLVYAAFAAVVLLAGRAAGTGAEDASPVRGGVGVAVGTMFLVGAALSWWHPHRNRAAALVADRTAVTDSPTFEPTPGGAGDEPAWASRLRDPSVKLVVVAGLVLAVVNPNVAILASGLGVVLTAEVSPGQQLVGVCLLLAASMVDFVVPSLVFVAAGERGRAGLRNATGWLLAHNHVIGIVVLAAFGLLFTARGLAQLLG